MKQPKDGDRIEFNKKVETFEPIGAADDKKWRPNEGNTQTYTYGQGTPTPSLPLEEMAAKDVREYYPYLVQGSPEFERRVREFLAKY